MILRKNACLGSERLDLKQPIVLTLISMSRNQTNTIDFAAQKCSFEPTNMSARGHLGTCKDVFNKTGDGKVHLVFDETRKCQFGCQPGYTRIDGTYTCGPNNPNGETTGLKVGVVEGSPVKCVGKCIP